MNYYYCKWCNKPSDEVNSKGFCYSCKRKMTPCKICKGIAFNDILCYDCRDDLRRIRKENEMLASESFDRAIDRIINEAFYEQEKDERYYDSPEFENMHFDHEQGVFLNKEAGAHYFATEAVSDKIDALARKMMIGVPEIDAERIMGKFDNEHVSRIARAIEQVVPVALECMTEFEERYEEEFKGRPPYNIVINLIEGHLDEHQYLTPLYEFLESFIKDEVEQLEQKDEDLDDDEEGLDQFHGSRSY